MPCWTPSCPLELENARLDEHLLLPLHDEIVLQLPADEAEPLAVEIATLIRAELNGVELPVAWAVDAKRSRLVRERFA